MKFSELIATRYARVAFEYGRANDDNVYRGYGPLRYEPIKASVLDELSGDNEISGIAYNDFVEGHATELKQHIENDNDLSAEMERLAIKMVDNLLKDGTGEEDSDIYFDYPETDTDCVFVATPMR